MDRARIDGIALELEDAGAGEPVLLVHGALVADALRPLAREPALAGRHRLIVPRRRGYGGSGGAGRPASIVRHAADCRALLARLGVGRAHVVGHSSGAAIALQLALDAPDLVGTLAVLEPAVATGESGPDYRRALLHATERFRQAGARVAVDEFLGARTPGHRELFDRVLPGALEQAVADAATCFEAELPAVRGWRFGAPEARRLAMPVLVVLGGESDALHPRFAEVHRLLLDSLPRAEGLVIPGATHLMAVEDPAALAGALAGFLARHPLAG